MKTALITSGSRGIGKSISIEIGKEFHVVVGYVNSKDKATGVLGSFTIVAHELSRIKQNNDIKIRFTLTFYLINTL